MATFRGGIPTYGGDPNSGRPPGSGGPPNFGFAGALAQLPQCAVSLWALMRCGSITYVLAFDIAKFNIWDLRGSR